MARVFQGRRRPTLSALRIAVLLVAGALAGSPGCRSDLANPPAPPPEPSPQVRIEDVRRVGPYRTANVRGVAGSQRFYFAPGGICQELVREGGSALYLPEGRFGSLVATLRGPRCSPVGVADLATWRDRLPRRRSRYLQPREPASLRPAGSGPGVILARGALPLAVELRIPGPEDLVAILPDHAACRSLLAARSGMLEFRPEGPEALVLQGPDGRCPIRGLALPLSLE